MVIFRLSSFITVLTSGISINTKISPASQNEAMILRQDNCFTGQGFLSTHFIFFI